MIEPACVRSDVNLTCALVRLMYIFRRIYKPPASFVLSLYLMCAKVGSISISTGLLLWC